MNIRKNIHKLLYIVNFFSKTVAISFSELYNPITTEEGSFFRKNNCEVFKMKKFL